MTGTELGGPTSVRVLAGGGADVRGVVTAMARGLPAEGLAAPALSGRKRLLGVTYELLDRRILEYAAGCLEQDVATPLARCLTVFEDVRTAAANTLADPARGDIVELGTGRPLTATQRATVTLHVGRTPLATVSFALEITAELTETSLSVRAGAVDEVIWTACSLSVSLSLEGFTPPLWKPDRAELPRLRLPVQPPVPVPLVEVPRPRRPSRSGAATGTRWTRA